MNERDGLRVPSFPFDSPLAAKAVALERLRGELPRAAEDERMLAEVGELHQLISSIISARIEGNHTTIADAIDGAQRREEHVASPQSDPVQEILHLQDAADFLDRALGTSDLLTHSLLRELHRLVTRELQREADPSPGSYRAGEVAIRGSDHRPPPTSATRR